MASYLFGRTYRLLTEEDDEGRACEAISDEACVEDTSRAVFVLLLAAAALWALGSVLFAMTIRAGRRHVRVRRGPRRSCGAAAGTGVPARHHGQDAADGGRGRRPVLRAHGEPVVVGRARSGCTWPRSGWPTSCSIHFWGRIADGRSARLVLLGGLTGMLATVTALVLAAIGGVAPILFALAFLLAATAEAGVRLAPA